MKRFLSVLVASMFLASAAAYAAEEKKTDGKAKAEASKSEGKAKGDAKSTEGKAKADAKSGGKAKSETK